MMIECPSCGLKEERKDNILEVLQCSRCKVVFDLSEAGLPDQGLSERIWRVKGEKGLPVSLRVLKFRIKTGSLKETHQISGDGKNWIDAGSQPLLQPFFSHQSQGSIKSTAEEFEEFEKIPAISRVSPDEKANAVNATNPGTINYRFRFRQVIAYSSGLIFFALITSGALFFPFSSSVEKLTGHNRQLAEENVYLKSKLSQAERKLSDLEQRFSTLGEEFEKVKSSEEEFQKAKNILEDIKKSIDSNKIYLALSLEENTLYVKMGTKILKKYTASTGKGLTILKGTGKAYNFLTPRGKRIINAKERNPVWYKPDWVWQEQGLELPDSISLEDRAVEGELGKFRLKLGDGYAIHGTKSGVVNGKKETHGCIRMSRKDLKELYAMVRKGTEVYIY